jgi:hypothetical protein
VLVPRSLDAAPSIFVCRDYLSSSVNARSALTQNDNAGVRLSGRRDAGKLAVRPENFAVFLGGYARTSARRRGSGKTGRPSRKLSCFFGTPLEYRRSICG